MKPLKDLFAKSHPIWWILGALLFWWFFDRK
jgi:hypothetical protein